MTTPLRPFEFLRAISRKIRRHWRQFLYFMDERKEVRNGQHLRIRLEVKRDKERLGSGYGGHWICPDEISAESVVYSVGIGNDISFDLELIEKYGCTVHAFDPTPESVEWVGKQDLPEEFKFHALGLAESDGTMIFYPPRNPAMISHRMTADPETKESGVEVEFKSISSIMEMLNHDSIDLLKMDIEGAEYGVIRNICLTKPHINQICLEFHHFFPNVDVSETRNALMNLKQAGFEVFSQERYNFGLIAI